MLTLKQSVLTSLIQECPTSVEVRINNGPPAMTTRMSDGNQDLQHQQEQVESGKDGVDHVERKSFDKRFQYLRPKGHGSAILLGRCNLLQGTRFDTLRPQSGNTKTINKWTAIKLRR